MKEHQIEVALVKVVRMANLRGYVREGDNSLPLRYELGDAEDMACHSSVSPTSYFALGPFPLVLHCRVQQVWVLRCDCLGSGDDVFDCRPLYGN